MRNKTTKKNEISKKYLNRMADVFSKSGDGVDENRSHILNPPVVDHELVDEISPRKKKFKFKSGKSVHAARASKEVYRDQPRIAGKKNIFEKKIRYYSVKRESIDNEKIMGLSSLLSDKKNKSNEKGILNRIGYDQRKEIKKTRGIGYWERKNFALDLLEAEEKKIKYNCQYALELAYGIYDSVENLALTIEVLMVSPLLVEYIKILQEGAKDFKSISDHYKFLEQEKIEMKSHLNSPSIIESLDNDDCDLTI